MTNRVKTREISYPSSIDPHVRDLRARVAFPEGGLNLPVLVLLHGWREVVADFDQAAVERFARGQWLELDIVNGSFIPGENVCGQSSGAIAITVAAADNPTMRRITLGLPDRAFAERESITGELSNATAIVRHIHRASIFALFVEMRGRGNSDGTPDGGGREIQDIIDGVHYVLRAFGRETDPTQIHAAGYSGGGGNVFCLAARFPDYFNTLTAHFGISDYGHDPVDGWYYHGANDAQRVLLEAWIGDPTRCREAYRTRDTVPAVTNNRTGTVRLYHDTADRSTPVGFSLRVLQAFQHAGMLNCTATITSPGDTPRAIHGLPNVGNQTTLFEPEWMLGISDKRCAPCELPAAGQLAVLGWVETKRFALWFGDGRLYTGWIRYDTNEHSYALTAHRGNPIWRLSLKGQKARCIIHATINGIHHMAESDEDGTVTFTGTLDFA